MKVDIGRPPGGVFGPAAKVDGAGPALLGFEGDAGAAADVGLPTQGDTVPTAVEATFPAQCSRVGDSHPAVGAVGEESRAFRSGRDVDTTNAKPTEHGACSGEATCAKAT